jgi:magnesium transporter
VAVAETLRVLRLEKGRILRGGRELTDPGAPIWLDLTPSPEALAFLAERFQFHPLALEDCAHEDQRVKFEQFDDHLFLVVHRMMPAPDDSEIWPKELHAFLTPEALVTVHSTPIAEVDAVFERCCAEPALFARGPDFALYLVYDALADVHFALVDALSTEVEELADEVLSREAQRGDVDLLDRIILARRRQSVLRKRLAPQREVYAALARPGIPCVKRTNAVYFRDVVDHAVRLTEEVDTERDLLASAQDAHLSHVNNRLSAVMARLTLVSTIFLPLNFLAGFFGMNLEIIPPRLAVPVVTGAMLALPALLYFFFRKKRWL